MSPVASAQTLDERCIDTIRFLAVDGVQKANSGHPGMPMGAAPVAYVLFTRHLRFDPADPAWPDRDRFVLSAGHASMLLYSLLHLTGYDLSLDDLKAFRQWGSKTPGHPEYGAHRRRRDHHRPARPGLRQRRRHGHRRALPGGHVQRRRPGRHGPLHLRPRRRRRPDGGHLQRGRLARRPPEARQAHRPLRRQPHHHRRHHRPRLHRGRRARASRPTAGTCSASPTATTSDAIDAAIAAAKAETGGRRSSPCAPTSASARPTSRTRPAPTARRWAPTRSS